MTDRPRLTLSAAVLDAPDARELAAFYQRLLGWEIGQDEPDWVTLRPPGGGAGLSFQTDPDHVPPRWPADPGDQRMMVHLDIEVDDLDAAGTHAAAAGAVLAAYQPQQDVRVYLDPAGHPFCLWIDTSASPAEGGAEAAAEATSDAGEWQRYEAEVGKVLAIVAHPDDLEYGAAAAVARWTRAGNEVVYLLATRGEAGIDGLPPEECGPLRVEEQQRSAAVVGVDVVEFLDHPDGVITYGLGLRRDLVSAIRRHRPDTVVTINHRETWGPGALNSADHRAVGAAVLDAAADAGNRWIFPDVGGEPHSVTSVLIAGSPAARHVIDVSDTVDLAVASLAEHRTYLEGLGDHPMADPEFLRWMLEGTGAKVGCDAGVAVEVFGF